MTAVSAVITSSNKSTGGDYMQNNVRDYTECLLPPFKKRKTLKTLSYLFIYIKYPALYNLRITFYVRNIDSLEHKWNSCY